MRDKYWNNGNTRSEINWCDCHKYTFKSSSGTPVGFTPIQVWYGKKGIGSHHQVEYTYNQRCQLAYKYNTKFLSG